MGRGLDDGDDRVGSLKFDGGFYRSHGYFLFNKPLHHKTTVPVYMFELWWT